MKNSPLFSITVCTGIARMKIDRKHQLVEKEWKQGRYIFLLALLLMTAFSFLLIFLHILMPQQDPVRSLRHYIDSNRVFGQYIFPILLALILGILPFHNELSRDHVDFLMSYPVTAGKVFRTKYFFNILMLFFSRTGFIYDPSRSNNL